MNAPPGPMTLGEILDRTFQTYKASFWVFFGLSALPALAMMALQLLNLIWWKAEPPKLIPILGINLGLQLFVAVQYHCSLFFHALIWPCSAFAASQAFLGMAPELRTSISDCAHRWKSWFGLALLIQITVVVMVELAGAGIFLGITGLVAWLVNNDEPTMESFLPFFMGAMILAAFAFSLWMGTLYLESIPAWSVERLAIGRSFKRARLLSKGCRWRILTVRVVPATFFLALDIMLATGVRWGTILIARMSHLSVFHFATLYGTAIALIAAAVSALVGPVFPIALTLIYYDQRIRKEGFDVELLMQQAGMTMEPALAAIGNPMQAEIGSGIETEHPAELA